MRRLPSIITMIICLLAMILITKCVNAQNPYAGVGIQNKGMNMSAGLLVKNVDLNLQYSFPLVSAIEPRILSVTAGLFVPISKKEQDNYSFTVSVGGGWRKYRPYNKYEDSLGEPVVELKPVVGVELGKDSYMGRISIVSRYCGKLYYGLTMRVFLTR